MPELHIIMGLPNSGKTTYAENSGHIPVDNACLLELEQYTDDTPNGPRMSSESWQRVYADMQETLEGGEHVVVDGNNTQQASRTELLAKGLSYGASTAVLHVMCTPPGVCLKRKGLNTEERRSYTKMLRHQTDLFVASLADIPNETWDLVMFVDQHHTEVE